MKTLILDGAPARDPMADRVALALTAALQRRGWDAERVVLREQRIGACAGDFFCWIKRPGVCNVDDDNRVIAAKVAASDLVVVLTPITFGGYSSVFKGAQDHLIQNISPFFTTVDGETHHQRRYDAYAKMLVIGWLDAPDAAVEAVFRHLAQRNALNMYARTCVSGALTTGDTDAAIAAHCDTWLDAIGEGRSDAPVSLPTLAAVVTSEPPRRALLLVGSPRTKASTSASLGGYLLEQLAALGLETSMVYIHTSLGSPARVQALLAAVDAADLIVLACPLYVDSLPAPVIAALQRIAAHRRDHAAPARLAAIINCGFPEATHCDTALAICARFAAESGMAWQGGLALGAGEGIVHGAPVKQLGGRGRHIAAALDLAAAALAAGQAVPAEAAERLAKPVIPGWLYRLIGRWGWRQQARQHDAQRNLRDRPYTVAP